MLLNNASSPKKIIAIILETTARELRHYPADALQYKENNSRAISGNYGKVT